MPQALAQPYSAGGYGGANPAAAAPNHASFAAAPAQPPPFEAQPQQQSYDGLPPTEGAPVTNENGALLSLPTVSTAAAKMQRERLVGSLYCSSSRKCWCTADQGCLKLWQTQSPLKML